MTVLLGYIDSILRNQKINFYHLVLSKATKTMKILSLNVLYLTYAKGLTINRLKQ